MAAKAVVNEKLDGQEPTKANTDVPETDQAETAAPGTESGSATPTPVAKNDNGGRKRKRHLFNSIRTQMEFYFGDANLSKDRFLRRYVEQDPFVPLEIFLTFNKIKTLTQDVQQISMSLSNSQLLQLDESGLKVRRKTALPEQRDVNNKTLYVEALPATATHDWLKEVFSRYGGVAYVSLPHYPGTRKIKQFAFIEFEKSASVEKAVKAFSQIKGVLSVERTDPAKLASVRSFQQQQLLKSSPQTQEVATETTDELKHQATAAIKREGDKDVTKDAVAAKRVKLEQEHSEASGVATNDAADSQPSETDDDNDKDDNGDKEQDAQQKRRRKQTKKAIVDKEKPNIEPSALELKVLPKSSWCSLRNKYLNLQRRIISEAKIKLWRSTQAQQQQQPSDKTCTDLPLQPQQQLLESKGGDGVSSDAEQIEPLSDANDVAEAPVAPKRRKRNKNAGVHKMNMNFYGAGGNETDDSKLSARAEDPAQERSPLFKYEPGLIVECALHEPCTNIKEFKADMRQYTDIKYVDIKEGDQLAHLRMVTPNAAEELSRQLSCAEMQLKVLRGQPETLYWRKIEQDREAKLTKKVRVQQKRGREKVGKLLSKHIKFDDADDELGLTGGITNDQVNTASIAGGATNDHVQIPNINIQSDD